MPPPTRYLVDLDALHHNLAVARARAGGRKVLAAVKANAYGHGLAAVALSIQERASADWLGIALTNEGSQLRAAGVTMPILKFSPTLPDDLPEAIAAGITLSVDDVATIRQAQSAARAAGRVVDVHLKVDTGMRRVGFEPEAAEVVAAEALASPNLRATGIFTHLPISDVPAGREFTNLQFQRFSEVVDRVTAVVGPLEHVHAGSSAAVLSHDLRNTTMVRPGIMIYGSPPDPGTPGGDDLRAVGRWTSRVTFLKRVAAGESVGYGRTWMAPRDTWIATVGVGYGDGYSRQLSSRGRMLINGHSYPIAGRICMDQTMLDLGPQRPEVRVGDEVVLIGSSGEQRIGVQEIADLMGTISYEVMCLITARVPRSYI